MYTGLDDDNQAQPSDRQDSPNRQEATSTSTYAVVRD
jgi:hypothetical protein